MLSPCLPRLSCYLAFILYHSITATHALYISPVPYSHQHNLSPRNVVVTKASNGSTVIIDLSTNQQVPQGPATDGSGSNFSPPALIWLAYCILLGLPLALAGIRGWRLTTGAGIGVCFAVAAWAALINSVNEIGIPDLILTLVVIAFSFLGFILGVFRFAYRGGIVGMTLAGGIAFGIRIILIQPNLLISADNLYALNWIIPVLCSVVAGLALIRWQRIALLFGCTSVGTFLVFLAVDLVVNRQAGMSRGLRYLFDRNSNHLADIATNGYHPTLSTRILILASLGFTPILAYTQHRIFRTPFNRKEEPSDELLSENYPTDLRAAPEGAKLKSANRFSL
ncbi:hypothetical protein E1B28_010283 [Marasmius oreades]|uniref:TM7S3/TM198-like domain-containing protein n=1 Tax=Marasmius oreades TaxID=181124 RepID=A0A9P7UQZ5_9AGAR|nr:uncharacterized protein E1B28_010283 [Marasmius oreades]KAG7091232.1 hypothetical protein E1B28_010283 [Marasmius oreades]